MARTLTINRNTQSLVTQPGQTSETLSAFQINEEDFIVQVVDDSSTVLGQAPAILDLSNYGLRAVLYLNATGTEGDEAENTLAVTYQSGWAWNSTLQSFVGTIDFHTLELADFIGNNSSATAHLEFNLVRPNGRMETIYQTAVSLKANADIGSTVAPTVLSAPATLGEMSIQASANVFIAGNLVTVTGLGLGFVPSYILVSVNAPSGYGAIGASVVTGSGSTDGFQFILTSVPEVNTYRFTYILIA